MKKPFKIRTFECHLYVVIMYSFLWLKKKNQWFISEVSATFSLLLPKVQIRVGMLLGVDPKVEGIFRESLTVRMTVQGNLVAITVGLCCYRELE